MSAADKTGGNSAAEALAQSEAARTGNEVTEAVAVRLSAIRARERGALFESWHKWHVDTDDLSVYAYDVSEGTPYEVAEKCTTLATAQFIAAAKQDVPAMLDLIEAYEHHWHHGADEDYVCRVEEARKRFAEGGR